QLLGDDWNVDVDVWSVTSWNELRRDAVDCEQANLLNPSDEPRVPYVSAKLADAAGPVVAVSDFMRAVPDQISRWVPNDYTSLGTDGFGFADTRGAARRFFHVDAESIVLGVLTQLARTGEVKPEAPREAIERYSLLDVAAAGIGTIGGDA
ncbi:MAG TPA: pyruvate dehydrogenase (acetyl-transferring), homodimeric type, partial [Jatrophihabitantaceae bacterium]|nr:pyruvate dehydrogenase (acetyl-transferring), homodimeric type [Jatrophihabitantaceae bacterium]